MEKKRPNKSVGFFAYARTDRADAKGFSPIFITATVSVLVLLAALGWEMSQSLQATNTTTIPRFTDTTGPALPDDTSANGASPEGGAATSSDPISNIGAAVMKQLEGAYAQMQQAGGYSSSTAQIIGQSLAPYVAAQVSYPMFAAADLKTDGDTSYVRMLQYRSDLRTSLGALLKNSEPEYAIFAMYVSTQDVSYLAKLKSVAQNYRTAASSTAEVVVPEDAVSYHVAILNAMEEFAATLDSMAGHADDPFASVALLRGYNQAESDMLTSFNSLTTYYKSKTP